MDVMIPSFREKGVLTMAHMFFFYQKQQVGVGWQIGFSTEPFFKETHEHYKTVRSACTIFAFSGARMNQRGVCEILKGEYPLRAYQAFFVCKQTVTRNLFPASLEKKYERS